MKPAKTPTVLVPIDFSKASAAGLRFALQWATQQKIELRCAHVVSILQPTSWNEARYRRYADAEKQRRLKHLKAFVNRTCKQAIARRPGISFLLIEAMSTDVALEEYCRRHKDVDYICMGTKGATWLKKLFGTHTGNLIMHSGTPVIAVPATYRRRAITRILHASDLVDSLGEIKRVARFANPLKARVRVLHFTYPGDMSAKVNNLPTDAGNGKQAVPEVRILHADLDVTILKNLQRHIAAFRPSAVVLFTRQERTAFQRLLDPGTAESLSFQLRTPLLVFAHSN